MKSFLKKLTLIMVCVSMFVSLTGCYTAVKPDKDPKKLVQDVKRTSQIKKEKDLIDGQVYMKNDVLTATMVFKDNVSEKDAKELVNKYAEALKKEYKGTKINIQAVQKNKNIANVVIPK
ncbi:hypothetical protein Ccar_22695 [Clostridium carboxidivorans P7]|uniref:Putative lipoprotein n=1 Tax=Clostridium carboxidivorans P7 TaxID=536227 RepID=C6PWI3_9CLOT|nr:hypothetical protein [Clostridium carboxidivorans]AKN33482.1 hypothetical protein Ccar_22695 [Clostridium carboxidivorans P7]EET86394.1 putative lipoprotein [Clostridium carboxidivorans P7]EFG89137.1 lipoprotein, putative [Clostridium carboxidivorans P7]